MRYNNTYFFSKKKKKTARKAVTYVEASLGKVDPILSQGDEGEY